MSIAKRLSRLEAEAQRQQLERRQAAYEKLKGLVKTNQVSIGQVAEHWPNLAGRIKRGLRL